MSEAEVVPGMERIPNEPDRAGETAECIKNRSDAPTFEGTTEASPSRLHLRVSKPPPLSVKDAGKSGASPPRSPVRSLIRKFNHDEDEDGESADNAGRPTMRKGVSVRDLTPVKSLARKFEKREESSLDALPFRTVRNFFPETEGQSVHVSAEKQKYEDAQRERQHVNGKRVEPTRRRRHGGKKDQVHGGNKEPGAEPGQDHGNDSEDTTLSPHSAPSIDSDGADSEGGKSLTSEDAFGTGPMKGDDDPSDNSEQLNPASPDEQEESTQSYTPTGADSTNLTSDDVTSEVSADRSCMVDADEDVGQNDADSESASRKTPQENVPPVDSQDVSSPEKEHDAGSKHTRPAGREASGGASDNDGELSPAVMVSGEVVIEGESNASDSLMHEELVLQDESEEMASSDQKVNIEYESIKAAIDEQATQPLDEAGVPVDVEPFELSSRDEQLYSTESNDSDLVAEKSTIVEGNVLVCEEQGEAPRNPNSCMSVERAALQHESEELVSSEQKEGVEFGSIVATIDEGVMEGFDAPHGAPSGTEPVELLPMGEQSSDARPQSKVSESVVEDRKIRSGKTAKLAKAETEVGKQMPNALSSRKSNVHRPTAATVPERVATKKPIHDEKILSSKKASTAQPWRNAYANVQSKVKSVITAKPQDTSSKYRDGAKTDSTHREKLNTPHRKNPYANVQSKVKGFIQSGKSRTDGFGNECGEPGHHGSTREQASGIRYQSSCSSGYPSGTASLTKTAILRKSFVDSKLAESDQLPKSVERHRSEASRWDFASNSSKSRKFDAVEPRYLKYEHSPHFTRNMHEQHERRKRLEESIAQKSLERQSELRAHFEEKHRRMLEEQQEEVRRGQDLHMYNQAMKEKEQAALLSLRRKEEDRVLQKPMLADTTAGKENVSAVEA